MSHILNKIIKWFSIHLFVVGITTSVIILIIGMSAIVVHDRIKFHNQIYKNAHICVKSRNWEQHQHKVHHLVINSVLNIDSLQKGNSNNCQSTTKYEIDLTPNYHNYDICNQDKTEYHIANHHNCIEDSKLKVLKDSDGLLNANGLTYLITLIVALLSALVINSTDKVSKYLLDIGTIRDRLEEKAKVLEDKARVLDDKTKVLEDKAKAIEGRANSYHKHITKYNHILTRIGSAYNLSTQIGNVMFSTHQAEKNETKEAILQQLGMLLYRLSKMCKETQVQLKVYDNILGNLTEEEKDIIYTYIEDSQNELDRIRDSAEKDLKSSKLSGMINNILYSINEIRETINSIKEE